MLPLRGTFDGDRIYRGSRLPREPAVPVKPIPDGYRSVTPYLIVDGAAAAITFYKTAFGATERLRLDGPDGKIGHAELQIGDSLIMLADEHPEMGALGPRKVGGSSVGIHLYLADVDAATDRAVTGGAKLTRPVANQFYGDRLGTIEDPFGHIWHISTHIEDVSHEEIARRAAAMTQGQEP
jgi:PhnB protein